MYVCLGWLIDMDGDLALINPTRPVIKGEFGQDPKEGCKENLRPTLKLVAPVPSPSFPLRYWSSKALKILCYCNITIPYLTYKTFQTLIKSPNIHKWGETFQIPRHRSKWPNKNCSHHKGGGGETLQNPHLETDKPTDTEIDDEGMDYMDEDPTVLMLKEEGTYWEPLAITEATTKLKNWAWEGRSRPSSQSHLPRRSIPPS